tara:strand:- start:51 stop:278 length:228 start_codon:yes stop_codon:yes gene_type:complete
MANPIGHLSHKKFGDLTGMERVEVILAYNDFHKYPRNNPPKKFELEHFWDSWNYEGKSRYDYDIDYIKRVNKEGK